MRGQYPGHVITLDQSEASTSILSCFVFTEFSKDECSVSCLLSLLC